MRIRNPVIIKIFPARESLVIDIPARDGKIENIVLQGIHSYCIREQMIIARYKIQNTNKKRMLTNLL
jgi:hypothetical protein